MSVVTLHGPEVSGQPRSPSGHRSWFTCCRVPTDPRTLLGLGLGAGGPKDRRVTAHPRLGARMCPTPEVGRALSRTRRTRACQPPARVVRVPALPPPPPPSFALRGSPPPWTTPPSPERRGPGLLTRTPSRELQRRPRSLPEPLPSRAALRSPCPSVEVRPCSAPRGRRAPVRPHPLHLTPRPGAPEGARPESRRTGPKTLHPHLGLPPPFPGPWTRSKQL